jgi:hypothetical protein
MHRSCVIAFRIAALPVVLAFAQLMTSSTGQPQSQTVYAIEATPSAIIPTTGPTPQLATAQSPSVFATPNPGATAAPPSPAQQTSDQIASVSQQVTQTVQDPSMPVDAKVQLINSLAALFNQLVAQWQLQVAQTPPTVAASSTTGVIPTPTAGASPANTSPVTMPPPTNNGAPTAGGQTVDQLRTQVAALSQQMAKVSQDPSLSPDARAAQIGALTTQYNQLMTQLHQLGG